MQHRLVTNWDSVVMKWEELFIDKLKVLPSNHAFSASVGSGIDNVSKQKICQLAFEEMGVAAFCIPKNNFGLFI